MKIKLCEFCEKDGSEGVWKIIIFKKWRGVYAKSFNNICHNCLAEALEGCHTGGGLTGNVIKKIKRVGVNIMSELEEKKRIIKVIRELEVFKYKLIQDINDTIMELEKIIKG